MYSRADQERLLARAKARSRQVRLRRRLVAAATSAVAGALVVWLAVAVLVGGPGSSQGVVVSPGPTVPTMPAPTTTAAPADQTTTTRLGPSGIAMAPTPGSQGAPPIRAPRAQLTGSGTGSGDNFGSVVAMSGEVAVVGAPAQGGGRAYLFASTAAGRRQMAELHGSDTAAGDDFGLSLAVAGSTVAVGAPAHAGGRVYLFTDTAGGWKQTAELEGSDSSASDRFGTSVALSGSNLVVSAPGQASSAGRVYVFAETQAGWRQAAELKGSDTTPDDQFGAAVAISGPNLVVSAPFHPVRDQAVAYGAVYVFTQTAGAWRQGAEFVANENAYGEGTFGTNVAISGTTVLVVAENQNPRESPDARHQGRALVFVEAGTAWHEEGELYVPDLGGDFAGAVALSGTRAVVAHGSAGMAGGAYLFAKTASGWQLTAYLNGTDGNVIASSVAITATQVLVGDTSGVFVFDT